MSESISVSRFKSELFDLLDETFETHHGIYTYEGTSLIETLDSVTAGEASALLPDGCFCIAAHVAHVILFLETIEQWIRTNKTGDDDWEEIWLNVRHVTPEEWEELKARLRETYRRIRSLLEGIAEWEGESPIAGSLAIVVHTAYHLGAIRQLISVARGSSRP